MKRHIFNTFILGFAIASCTDPFMGQTATDHVAPGPIKNAKVINLDKDSEPDIYNAIKRNALLENVSLDAEGKIDEAVFELHHRFRDRVDAALELIRPEMGIFRHVLAEKARHRVGVKRFVRNRPGDDLPHSLHRAVAGEVEEHHEAGEKLHPFRESRERRDAGREAVFVVFGDFVEEVVFRGHRFVLKEFVVDGFRQPQRFDEMRVRGDVSVRFFPHHAETDMPLSL